MKKTSYKSDTEFVVENPGLLLECLLFKFEHKSRNSIKSLLLHGSISVDGKVVTRYDHKLSVGQKISIKRSRIYDKSHKEILDIIFEDSELIAINKPAGLLSIATDNEKERTAYRMVMDYVKRNNPKNKIFIVHRLDRDTSGVLVLSKKENIKRMLQDKWDYLVSVRGYTAIVEGRVEKSSGTIRSWLNETSSLMVYSSDKKEDGKEAVTHYRKIKENEKYSVLDIRIDTGRKNQIRVHMKDIGHSVIGDKKYGAKTNPLKRLGLHASVLEFKHPITKNTIHLEASLPKEFMLLFKK